MRGLAQRSPERPRIARVMAVAAWTAAVALFAGLAVAVATGSAALHRFDAGVSAWLQANKTPALTELMLSLTWAGAPAVLLALAAIAALVALRNGRPRDAMLLILAVGGGEALNGLLKLLFQRARPVGGSGFAILHSYSFPSGHALGATVACGALMLIAMRGLPARAWRLAVAATASLVAGAICASRIYLGAHYASDVFAGVLEGVLWLGICVLPIRPRSAGRPAGPEQ